MTGNCSVLYTGEEMRGSAMMHIDPEAEDADTASVTTSVEDSWCVGAAHYRQGSRTLRDLASRRSAIREREQRGALVDHVSTQSSFTPSTSLFSMRGSRRGSSRGRSSARRSAPRARSRGVKTRGRYRRRGQYHSPTSPQPSSSFGVPRQARVVLNRLEDTGVRIENNGIYQVPYSTSPTVSEEVNYNLHSEYICSSPEMRNEEDFDDIECPDLRGIYHEDHCSPLLYDNEEPPPRRHIKYHVHFQYDGDDDSSEGNTNNYTNMSDYHNFTDTLTTNNEQPGTSSVVGSDTCVSTSDNPDVDKQKYPFDLEMSSHNAQTPGDSVQEYPPPLYEDISDAEEIVTDNEDIPIITVEDSEDCEKDPLEEQLHRLLDTPSPAFMEIRKHEVEEDDVIELLPDSSGIQKPQTLLARRVSAPAQLSPSPPKRTEPRTRKLSWPAGKLDEDTDSSDRSSDVNLVAFINKLKLARDRNSNWQIIPNNRDTRTNYERPSTSRYHSDDPEVISEEPVLQSNAELPYVSEDCSRPSTPRWSPKIVHVTSQALWFRNATATSTASPDQVNHTASEFSNQDIHPTFSAGIIAPEIEETDQNEVQTISSGTANLPNISIVQSVDSAANQNVASNESQPFHANETVSNENCKIVLASPSRNDLSERNKENGGDKIKSLPEANYATVNLAALVLDEANNNVNSTLCQDREVARCEQNEDVAEENVEMKSDEGNKLSVTAATTQMEPVEDCSSFIMDTQSDDDDEDALKIDEDRISCSEVETSLSAEKPSECEEGNACKAETSCDTPDKREVTAVVDSYATDCDEDLEDDELTVTEKPEDAAECTDTQVKGISKSNQSVQPECSNSATISNSSASLRDNGDREYMKDRIKDVRINKCERMGERIVQSSSIVVDAREGRETNSGVRSVEVVKLSGQALESALMLTNKDKVSEHSVTVVDSSSALPQRDNIVVDKTARDSGTVSNDVHTRTFSSVGTEATPGSSMLCEKTPVVNKAVTEEFQELLATFEKTELGNCPEQLGSLNSVVADNGGSDSNQKTGAKNDIESDSSKTSAAVKVRRKSRTSRKKYRHDNIKPFKASAYPPWMYTKRVKVTTTAVDSSGTPLSLEIMVIPDCSATVECEPSKVSDQVKPECEQENKMPSSEKKRVEQREEEVPSDSKKHHLPSSSESSDDDFQEANSENNLEEDEKGLGAAKKRLRKRKRRFRRKKREGSSTIMEEVSQHILDTQMQEKERRLAQEIPRFNWLEEKIKNGAAVPVAQPAKKAKSKDSDGSLEEKSPPATNTAPEESLEIRKTSEVEESESKVNEDTSVVNKTPANSSSPDVAKKPEQVRAPVIVSLSTLKSNPETINPVLQHLTSHGDLEVTLANSTACSSSSVISPPLPPVTIKPSPKPPPPPLIAVHRHSGSDMPLATLVPVQSHSRVAQRSQSATASTSAPVVPTTCSVSEVPVSSSSSVPVQHSRHGPPSEGNASWRYPPAWPVGETIRPAPGKPEKRLERGTSLQPPQLPFSMVAPPPFYLSEPVATMARHATTSFDTGLGLGLSVQQQQRYAQRQKQHQQPVPKTTLPSGPPQPSPLSLQGPYRRYMMAAHAAAAAHHMRSQPLKPAAQYPRHGLHPNAMFHPPTSLPAYSLPINPISQPPPLSPLESSSARLRLASAPKDVPSGSNLQPYHHSTVNSSHGQSDLPPPLTVVPEAQLGSDARYKQPESNYRPVHEQRSDREESQHKGGVGMKSASDGARNVSRVFYPPEESSTRSSHSSSPHHDAVINNSSPMPPDSSSPQAKGSLPLTPTPPAASVGKKRSSSSPPSGEDCPKKKIGLPPPAWPLRIRGTIKPVEVPAASGDKLNETTKPSAAHSSSIVSLLSSKSNMSSRSDGNDQDESPMDLSMCKRKSEDFQCVTPESTSVSKELATTAISQPKTDHLTSVLGKDSVQETRGTKEHSRLWHHLMSGPSSTRDPSSREASPKAQNLGHLASPGNEPIVRSFDNHFREQQVITTEHIGLSQSREQNISVTGITTNSVENPITSQSRQQHVLVPRSAPETLHLKELTVTKTMMEPVKIPPSSGHMREQPDVLIKRSADHGGAVQIRDRQISVTNSTEQSGIQHRAHLGEHLVSVSNSAEEPKRVSVCGSQQLRSHLVSAARNSTEVAGPQTSAMLREHVSVPKSASSLGVHFREGHYGPVPSAGREAILSSQDVQSRQHQAVPMPHAAREVQRPSQNVHFREQHRAHVPDHPAVPRNQMFRDHQYMPVANSIQDPSRTSHEPRLRNQASLQPVWPQNPETHINSHPNNSVVYQRGFEMPRHPQVPARFHYPGNGVHSAMPRYNMAPEQMYRGSQFPLEAMYFRHHREPHAGNTAIASAPQGRNFFSQQLSPVAAITPEMSTAANSPQNQKASPSSYRCHNCHDAEAKFMCSACHAARYCSTPCQMQHWEIHSAECRRIRNLCRT